MRSWMAPFLLALGGIISDYFTTIVGLNMGLCESHPLYHPIWALLMFWFLIAFLTVVLPNKKPWTLSINGIALVSYIGITNNTLVMLGLFSGLNI